ncbi:MAG: ABC transporter permease [Desulfopila sp.]
MTINFRYLYREMVEARHQAGIFILCVALAITGLVALNSFRRDVNRSIAGDARALHGGDIILHSHYPFSANLLAAVDDLRGELGGEARTWEFYSVVRSDGAKPRTLLSNIKVVEPEYPLYGEVVLASGQRLAERLVPGSVVVGEEVLARLHLQRGDVLHVGKAALKIADVIVRESMRPVELFSFGPRVFVAAADLATTDLVRTGSRVQHEMLLKLREPTRLPQVTARLEAASLAGQERVATFQNARSGLKRFFDNLLFFLSLISIFTLLLAGIGMQSSLAAMLRQKEKGLATVKALGATSKFIFGHYLLLVLAFGLVGSLLGLVAGMGLKHLFPLLLAGVLPSEQITAVRGVDIGEGLVLGLVVVVLFTFLPLYRLGQMKPSAIFRQENASTGRGAIYYGAIAGGAVVLTVLVIHQLDDVRTGLVFMAGVCGLILVMSGVASFLLLVLSRVRVAPLPLRQALRSLLRPGNNSRSVIVTLASALTLLLAIFLVQQNLRASYVESFPTRAPNLYFVDIQPDQRAGVAKVLGADVPFYPVIRARLQAIDGKAVQRGEKRRFRDSLTREFNLTYRDRLLADEELSEGATLFRPGADGHIPLQVSILDTVAEMGDIGRGDILDFNIQGVPLQAEVTSIRSRTKSRLFPFFYFVFPSQYLQEAPQTFFAALHVGKGEIPQLEARLVTAYPNISVVNLAEAAVQLGQMMEKLALLVSFFSLFSILAGTLLIVGSILSTRLARMREAVYYKVLGGRVAFVVLVFLYENILLGLLSVLPGLLLAQAGSWLICRSLFDIGYQPFWGASLLMTVMTIILVGGVGMASSVSIIREKPITFLREQTNE